MNRREGILTAALGLGAFAYNLFGLSPSVSVGDSGELITAACTLGIPHPPGFPAYLVLAKAWSLILPFSTPAWRVNLFSAACSALCVALAFRLLHKAKVSLLASLVATGVLVGSQAFAIVGRGSEVFALHAVCSVAVLSAAYSEQWLLACLFTGLALCVHQTILFLIPAAGLAWWLSPAAAGITKRQSFVGCSLMALTGFGLNLILIPLAQRHPFLHVGDPVNLDRLWRVIKRADYGSFTLALGEAPARDLMNTLHHLGRFALGLANQVTWVGVVLGLIGIAYWQHRDRRFLWLVLGGFLLIGPFFFVLGNLPFDAQSQGLLDRFHVVPVLYWILLIGGGIQWLCERQSIAGWVALILPLFLLIGTAESTQLRAEWRAYAYGRNNLRSLPPGALFIMDGGDDTFYTTAYLTQLEHRRPDIELHDRGGVVFPGLYGQDFRRLDPLMREPRRLVVEGTWVARGRPVYYSTMNDGILPHAALQSEGLLYAARLRPQVARDLWPLYDLRGLAPWDAFSSTWLNDYRLRALVPYYSFQRGVQAGRDAKDLALGLRYLRSANEVGRDVLWLIPNLINTLQLWGYQALTAGQLPLALTIYDWVLELNPNDTTAWSNRGAAHEHAEMLTEAAYDYERAAQLDPSSAQAHFNLAVAYWKMARWREVVEQLNLVLAVNPAFPSAARYLAQAQDRLRSAGQGPSR